MARKKFLLAILAVLFCGVISLAGLEAFTPLFPDLLPSSDYLAAQHPSLVPYLWPHSPGVITLLCLLTLTGLVAHRRSENSNQIHDAFPAFFGRSELATAVIDADTTFLHVNQGLAHLSGYDRKDLEGLQGLSAFIHPQDLPTVLAEHQRCCQDPDHTPQQHHCHFIDQKGQVHFVALTLSRLPHASACLAIFLDITVLKEREAALQQTVARFQSLVETTSDWIWEIDAHDCYTYASPTIKDLLGYTPEEVLGKTPFDLMPSTEADRLGPVFGALKNSRWPFASLENLNQTRDGRLILLETSGVPITAPDGSFSGYRGIDRDITGRKRMEEALRTEKARYEAIVQAFDGFIFIVSPQHTVEFLNQRAGQHLGNFPVGSDCYQVIFQQDRICPWCPLNEALQGKTISQEIFHSPSQRWYQVIYTPVVYGHGRQSALAIARDITARRQMAEEILKIRKLESLGIFAGGLAHDFNNFLTTVMGNINLVRLRDGLPEELQSRLVDAEIACTRASSLTQQLLCFAKGRVPDKQVSSLPVLLREAAGFILAGSQTKAEFTFTPDIWPAEVDPGQISQVFNNLLINALQAMPSGGVIEAGAQNFVLPADAPGLPLPPGPYVKLSIKDQGHGILPEHLDKIFDPFFTTKKQGSGLGLATAFATITQHGGIIQVESTPGQGAISSIYLPALPGAGLSDITPTDSAIPGTGRILIMDDATAVRRILGLMLRRLGYEPTFAADRDTALEIFRAAAQRNQPFHAVILDLTIPGGQGGHVTLEALRQIDPHIPAIITSGNTEDSVIINYRHFGFAGVLRKPFRLTELSHVLNFVLQPESPNHQDVPDL